MEPSQRLRRATWDPGWRGPVARLQPLQTYSVNAAAASPATPDVPAAAELEPPRSSAGIDAARPKRRRAVRPWMIGLVVVVAVNSGALLGLLGASVFEELARSLGLAEESPLEAMQRGQAMAISQLDRAIRALNAAIAGLSARVDFSGNREEVTSRRMTEIDDAIGGLMAKMSDMRAAQRAEPWRKPMTELTDAVTRARSDISELRSSLSEVGQARQPATAAIGARIDRIEQAMVQHQLLGPMRGSIEDPMSRQSASASDGHILNLLPSANETARDVR